jgi:hypothetical protein
MDLQLPEVGIPDRVSMTGPLLANQSRLCRTRWARLYSAPLGRTVAARAHTHDQPQSAYPHLF